MPPRVLLLDNATHRRLYKPAWPWKAHLRGIETETVNVPSGAPIPRVDRFTHVLLTGSEASILQPKPWFETEAQAIRQTVDRGIPLLASCFGHEMLVYALSGPEYLGPADPPEVGWADVEMLVSDPLFDGLPNPWTAFVFHFGAVVDPPPPWRKLGRSRHCDTHVLRYGDHPAWGIQAHPEISSRKAKRFLWISLLLGLKPASRVFRALRSAPPRNDVAETIIQQFLAH